MLKIRVEAMFDVDKAYERIIDKHPSILKSQAYKVPQQEFKELINGHSDAEAQALLIGVIKELATECIMEGCSKSLIRCVRFVCAYNTYNALIRGELHG